jgi:hypothetical protein
MRDVRGYIYEIACLGLGDELEPISPAQASDAVDDVNHTLKVTVMVRTGLGVGIDRDGACPEFRRARAPSRDGGATLHAQRLRRISIEFVGANDPYSVGSPPAATHVTASLICAQAGVLASAM